ncbi:hypothetical protein JD974_01815 [Chromobacterium haemolyticum]|uniref:Uncharacterized protein n=1 Tax=Chromobacterium haemolyticum TaxID=394935 RepID=A0ABS3GH20_9NEIS|nr:hypothetical protein [Chromobacterium haemolyticum]MBK0413132.1 hypothetical protein [Chromobacterium haemolyticum]MBO0414234.1 hypothetical protein [Chromobacterium haemolyticum]MBO0497494.1 hypothetical protein [Chromobacterium haemolyticum]
MDRARIFFNRKGELKEAISCFDITSREHYRNLWPLVTEDDPPRLVSWVSPVFRGSECVRRSYFRHYSGKRSIDAKAIFDTDEEARFRQCSESPQHKRAKELIAAELQRRLDAGLALPWAYNDTSVTDFYLGGNLLLGAESIVIEHNFKTPPPLSSSYRLDVAVLGKTVLKNPTILAGIEIEYGHAFDGRKAIAGRCSGYPLISIDITDLSLSDITPEWARRVLTATTRSDASGQRKTFVYLNPLLYPLYIQLPSDLLHRERRHQLVIFAPDTQLLSIRDKIDQVRIRLGLSEKDVVLQLPTAKSEQSATMVGNLGKIIGPDWETMNTSRCLTVSLDRPADGSDVPRYLMHIFLAIYLAGWGEALVGYKWCMGITNENPEDDLWQEWYNKKYYHPAPKRLAIPFSQYVSALSRLTSGSCV